MGNEIKWLKAAFARKFNESGLNQRQFGDLVGLSQAHVNRLLNSHKDAGPVEVWGRIAGALGYDLPRFIDYGRSLCEPDQNSPPSPQVDSYLQKARAVLETGGDKADILKKLIDIIKE